ncbi:MAG: DUF58 domain-containing protein [Verrucomicrobiaceae bacterium]|nr:MAG: DUF58 domain-containing protein [Verrucomicrobiaceae bacterium]
MKPAERIYIVPTWAGLILAAVAFSIFVAGYFADGFGSPAQGLVIALVVAGIVAMIRTNENLRGIEITSCRCEPVEAGGDAVLELGVTNTSNRGCLGLKVRFRDRWKLHGTGTIPSLHAGETRTVEVRVPTSRRGGFPVPSIWVSSNLPAGVCFAWKIFPKCGKYHVYPLGRSWKQAPPGDGPDKEEGREKRTGTEDVSGHRAYEPGDLLARMDWKVFARTGRLAVRSFDAHGAEQLLLRWEDTAFLQSEEDRLDQLSFWVTECLRGRRPFELRLGGGKFNERNPAACRVALATFGETA